MYINRLVSQGVAYVYLVIFTETKEKVYSVYPEPWRALSLIHRAIFKLSLPNGLGQS